MNKDGFRKWDLNEAKRFLECFTKGDNSKEPSERINIRVFSDKKGTDFKGKNLSFDIKEFSSKSKILMAHNEAERGIFFVVNSGGNSDSKIKKINAQFFECDTLSLEEQLENISRFPIEPSIIVQTRKSLHVYFLIKDGEVERFRGIQRKLAKYFNGDGSCINESRVMRVPGFYHCKEEPVRVKCIKLNPSLVYTQDELERELSYSESEFSVNDDKTINSKEINENCNKEETDSEIEWIYDGEEKIRAEGVGWTSIHLNTDALEIAEWTTYSLGESSIGKTNWTSINLHDKNISLISWNEIQLGDFKRDIEELCQVGIENNNKNLDSYISNYHSDLQESTLINRDNISRSNEENLNNRSKEQVSYKNEENLHSMSDDNISENKLINIIDRELTNKKQQEPYSYSTEFSGQTPSISSHIYEESGVSGQVSLISEEVIRTSNNEEVLTINKSGFQGQDYLTGVSGQATNSLISNKSDLINESSLISENLERSNGGEEGINTQNGLEVICFKCDFIKHCKNNSKTLSEPLWHGMITNLALFSGGSARIHELSKGYKTYSERETNGKISNFLKSGAGPMTCETLKDRGYTCKKLGKTCNCKSPASLAFKPLTVKELRACIKTLKVSEVSNATNVDTALKFIENYMYNIGVALGKSLIEEDLANYLKIKNPKDLIAFYREIIRKFKKDKGNEAKGKKDNKQKNGGNLPWYEEQDKGLKFLPFVLAKHLSETRHVYYGGESFLIYENGVYNISGEKEAGRIIMDYMLPNYCTMGTIRDCRNQWDILVSRDFDDFNRNPYIVNTRNGLLDIRDGSFKEHTPSYLSTVQLNVEYNPHADCPQFKKFLNEVLDCRLIPLVQEIVGYLLTTNTAAQKSFVFWGPARTGKSTLLWVVEYLLLGKINVSNIPWQDIGDKFKTAELLGKLANVFSDLPSKSIDDTGIFKVVTGEDYLMAEKKNKNPFKFKPFSRLVFSCNELPRNYVDRTEGFYRRIIIVPFTRQIEKSKVDKHLKAKFQKEKEGILNWALEGLKRLYENNFEFSENEITEEVKKDYKRENNNVISFVEECCELGETFQCIRGELYDRYKEFCEENGVKALSHGKFNKELEVNFNVLKDRNKHYRLWKRIQIKVESCYM
ncbi:DNA primase family protein [Clostridium sp. B9]|uniref:DNA primase family protein n=1 Tax=Clostridium sp. B9 TaxID=3423224 RepID=UPI003D2EF405